MPALPSVPSVLRADLNWQVDADTKAITRMFFRYSGGSPNAAACSSLASEILTAANSNLITLVPSVVGTIEATVTDLSSDTGAQGSAAASNMGTRAGSKLAPGTAVCVSHTINRRYRGGHPRTYLPAGVSSDLQTSGLWASAFTTAVSTGWTNFIAAIIGSGDAGVSQYVNVSYYKGSMVVTNPVTGRAKNVSTPRTTPVVDVITGSAAQAIVASQRRRNRAA